MPLEIIEASDALNDLVRFRTSAVYEMLVSLHTLIAGKKYPELAAEARATLPRSFWKALDAYYAPFNPITVFLELAVDYPDHDDVPGFIAYVDGLDLDRFLFYVFGRILPAAEIAPVRDDRDALIARLRAADESHFTAFLAKLPLDLLLGDVGAFRNRIVQIWDQYWHGFFRHQIEAVTARCGGMIESYQQTLARIGGSGMMELVTDRSGLPRQIPDGTPYTEIVMIPLHYITLKSCLFFGYGNITVLFHCERTEAQMMEEKARVGRLTLLFKALGDETRLTILRLIVSSEGKMSGKQMAAKLRLSPSTMSRQLAQLRDAGLIVEMPQPDQRITYRVAFETLEGIAARMEDFLLS